MTNPEVKSPADAGHSQVGPVDAVRIAEQLDDVEATIDVVSTDLERVIASTERIAVAHERIAAALERLADELKQPFRFSLVPRNWRTYVYKGIRVAIYAAIYGTIVTAAYYTAPLVLPKLAQALIDLIAGWQSAR